MPQYREKFHIIAKNNANPPIRKRQESLIFPSSLWFDRLRSVHAP
jgi:hypothetical protein